MINKLEFRKSSYSAQGQNCVEVAHIPTGFHKSSYSGASENCLEVGTLPGGAAMRDSKNPHAGYIPFPASEWSTFLTTELK